MVDAPCRAGRGAPSSRASRAARSRRCGGRGGRRCGRRGGAERARRDELLQRAGLPAEAVVLRDHHVDASAALSCPGDRARVLEARARTASRRGRAGPRRAPPRPAPGGSPAARRAAPRPPRRSRAPGRARRTRARRARPSPTPAPRRRRRRARRAGSRGRACTSSAQLRPQSPAPTWMIESVLTRLIPSEEAAWHTRAIRPAETGGAMAAAGTPVVFVHGLWLHADSWGAWVDLFREAGYEPSAPGLARRRGHGRGLRGRTRRAIAGHGIDDVVDHYAKHHRRARREADRDRPLLRRAHRAATARARTSPPAESRSTRRRSRA